MADVNSVGYQSIPGGGGTPSAGSLGSMAGNVMGVYNGLQRGGVAGYGGAALNAGSLYNSAVGNSAGSAIPGIGPAGDVLGIYNGVKQGGVAGYAGAAADAAQLYTAASAADVAAGGAGLAGAGAVGAAASVLGPIGAAYAVAQAIDAHNTSLSGNYWNTMSKTLSAGPGSGGTSLDSIKQKTAYEGAMAELMQSLTGHTGGLTGGVSAPFSSQQLAQWGITPQMIAQYNSDYSGTADYQSPAGTPQYQGTSRQKM